MKHPQQASTPSLSIRQTPYCSTTSEPSDRQINSSSSSQHKPCWHSYVVAYISYMFSRREVGNERNKVCFFRILYQLRLHSITAQARSAIHCGISMVPPVVTFHDGRRNLVLVSLFHVPLRTLNICYTLVPRTQAIIYCWDDGNAPKLSSNHDSSSVSLWGAYNGHGYKVIRTFKSSS